MTPRPRQKSAEAANANALSAMPVAASPARAAQAWVGVEVLLVLAAALLALYRERERDFWFHLAAGRDIVQHGLPHAERWCLAAYGQWPWLGEWLYHVALYLTRAVAGDVGVGLWRAAWSGLAMALALALARRVHTESGSGARPWAAALLAPLVLASVRDRLTARPEQVTVAFVLLFLLVFEYARRAGRDRTPWLLAVQIAWVNLHPGWILGPVVAMVYAALELLQRSAASRHRALRWAFLGLVFYAAGAVSPQPLDALSLRMIRDVRADPMMQTIEELRPWSWAEDREQPFTALLAFAAVAALVGGSRAWRASRPLTLAALAALAAGIASYRFRALGALVALPVLAATLAIDRLRATAGASSGVKGRPKLSHHLATALATLAAGAGLAWLVADAKYYPPGVAPFMDSVPVHAVALADSLHLEGPVLNTPWYGGYILWARGERHLPLQDTRNLGSAAFRSRLVRACLDPAAHDSLLAEWRFTHAILEPPMSPLDRLAVRILHHRDWALVFADDAGLLFVRRNIDSAWVAAHAYRLLSPDYAEMGALAERAQADSTLLRALTSELERARGESRWNARASLWLGLLALARGRAQAALGCLDHVEALAPATPGLALRQGLAHELLGESAAARRAYRRALRDTSDATAAREALARLGG